MLSRLVGRTHRVTTAVCLRRGGDEATHEREREHELTVTTEVEMVAADDAEVSDYVASEEWRGKAGAYAVQGIAAALVRGVRGSVTNVIGLPLAEVVELLRTSGAAAVAFRRGRPA
jgi:septum formation protein